MSTCSANDTGLPDRRHFLSTLAAAGALGLPVLPAVAAGAHADAALLALREPYERTMAAIDAASPAHSRAEDAVAAALAAKPGRIRAEVERECGLDKAEAAWNGAIERNSRVVDQIIETPARTIEGLIFKARVAEGDGCNIDLAASIVDDLVAMGAAHA